MQLPASLLTQAQRLLETHLGLNLDSLGHPVLTVALRARLAALALTPETYAQRLETAPEEVDELIEETVVPETWFFRDLKPFLCLREYARQQRTARPGETFRALSIPCCTGEEPYSLAMVLLDAGYSPQQIHIDAVDVSRRALERAKRAVYTSGSQRERSLPANLLLRAYTRPRREKIEVVEAVRRPVRFQRGNLIAPELLSGVSSYQFICCRNVLIYLHARARDVAIRHLERLLAPDGVLYLGHTEAAVLAGRSFRNFRPEYPAAFCTIPPAPASGAPGWSTGFSRSGANQDRLKPVLQPGVPEAGAGSKTEASSELELARRRADAGDLSTAVEVCERLLAAGPSAEVLYLLGVVRQAQGDAVEARRCFEKLLYLEPRHCDGLWRMVWLSEHSGDHRAAEQYRRRAVNAEVKP